jgi:serine/threonine protein kinase
MPFDTGQPAYQALRSIVSERTQPLLAWTGAGLSVPAGLPTWLGLRERLADVLDANVASMTGPPANRLRSLAAKTRSEQNLWVAFQMLADGLGDTTFRDEVRTAFAAAERSEIPAAYRVLWNLRIRGLLNLNIDGLATRAYSHEHPGAALVERSGVEIARLRHVLSGQTHFVGNLHGLSPDSGSWVFTKDQLDALLKDETYKLFLRLCLAGHTVMFLGMTVDDFAIQGHLESLARLGREDPTHFWITDRVDAGTNFWAEQVGVRVVRYDSAGGRDHSGLMEILEDLRDATPQELEPAPPVYPTEIATPNVALPGPEALRAWPIEDIRTGLNARAKEILSAEDDDAYAAYDKFRDEYDEVMHTAWYTSAKPGRNRLLGYTLESEVAKGAFGKVYRGISPSGEHVAIKVLLDDIRNETEMLQSFRRGVRSMRILSDSGVPGMVKYHDASEIPAFVVMDWVNGTNLGDARRAGWLNDWERILGVASALVTVLRRAHGLPERVLHRDLRPENVMLKDFYGDFVDWELVVLDFDLSWHKGAQEKSLLYQPSAGYLAPEQFRRVPGVSTRSAAVDSFGIGMTLLFMCRGDDPLPDEHRNRDFADTVRKDTGRVPSSEWRSAPQRFARLIFRATEDRQSARWDLSQIQTELDRLNHAVRVPDSVDDTELLVEELAARIPAMQGYTWSDDDLTASKALPTGLSFALRADLQRDQIDLRVEWNSRGVEERSSILKYLGPATNKTRDQLRSAGWSDVHANVDGMSVHIDAVTRPQQVTHHLTDFAQKIDTALQNLRF